MKLPPVLLLLAFFLFETGGSDYFKAFIVTLGRVNSGDDVHLNCCVTESPADYIAWYNTTNKNPMKQTTRPGSCDTLVLPRVTLRQATRYRCHATKGPLKDDDFYTLQVHAKPVVQLQQVHIVGHRLTGVDKTCTVTGFPIPNITWYWNGGVIRNEDRLSSIQIENKKSKLDDNTVYSVLRIFGVTRDYNGNYTCVATNEMGQSSKTLRFYLAEEPEVVPGGPQIIRENENVTLTCEVRKLLPDDPKVDLFWEFQGKSIPGDDARYKNSTTRVPGNAVHMELTVRNASTADSGRYDCNASSSAEHAGTGNVSLVVVKKDLKPTLRIVGPTERPVSLGSNVNLQCEVTYPAYMTSVNITWANRSSTTRFQVTKNKAEDLTSKSVRLSLHLVNIRPQDLGPYTCQMHSSVGRLTAQVWLSSYVKPVPAGNLVMVALIVTAGLATGLSGALWLLRLWRRRKSKPRYQVPMNNDEFKYDVFITFSGKDFAWVKTMLIPLLEKKAMNYCIHNRDFELGKGILDNMADSVYRSKKVLAVMSRHYMESKYCRGELEMALYRSTENGDSSLIVIRIDDIEKEKLPKALRNRTFLDYHDEKERKTWEERLVKHLARQTFKLEDVSD